MCLLCSREEKNSLLHLPIFLLFPCFSLFLTSQVSLFYNFLSVWRISLSHSFMVDLMMTNSLRFFCLWMSWFHLYSQGIFLLDIEFWVDGFFLYFIALVIIGGFVFWVGCSLLSFLLSFKLLFNFLIYSNLKNIYFNNFILFYFSFFFSPFLLSHVADRVLVLWSGVRPMPLRGESWVQDIGDQAHPGSTQYQMAKALPEISISKLRPSSTQRPAKYSARHPMPNN